MRHVCRFANWSLFNSELCTQVLSGRVIPVPSQLRPSFLQLRIHRSQQQIRDWTDRRRGGSGGAMAEGVMKKVLLSYAYVAVWIFLSFTVIVYNKYILDPKMYGWPFPISLTIIHMAFCSALAFLLVRVLRLVAPPASPPMTRRLYLSSVVPIGALYSLSLWFSNSAYIYLSVSFIQMLKALMPVAVYSISVLFRKEAFKPSSMLNMLSISFGVAIAAYGEARFVAAGVGLQLAAVAFEATRLVLIQILLTSKGISLNPITSLYYVAPCCLAFLLVPWSMVELPVLRDRLAVAAFRPDLLIFGTNSLCAFALNLAVFLLVGKTSALTMNVAGVVKDWLLIAFSWSVIRDIVTSINLFGYAIAFLGVAYYNHVKLQALKAKEAQKKAAQADEESGKLLDQVANLANYLGTMSAGASYLMPTPILPCHCMAHSGMHLHALIPPYESCDICQHRYDQESDPQNIPKFLSQVHIPSMFSWPCNIFWFVRCSNGPEERLDELRRFLGKSDGDRLRIACVGAGAWGSVFAALLQDAYGQFRDKVQVRIRRRPVDRATAELLFGVINSREDVLRWLIRRCAYLKYVEARLGDRTLFADEILRDGFCLNLIDTRFARSRW
ncbi:Triose-phosphate Transporter family [Musa troglodytarum]|uniref:Triose-phosphate Transporter family n=1 Tax=Musa troglodytarum TaxID=320322 RepID=A0A9E7HNU9_9LILI|nr:Triose-phosphate Transporter family [Musa troglodytarum]